METVYSNDGTAIAYDRRGKGPALVLVTGALATRSDATSVSEKLSQHFTVFTYDRRGLGDSGDALQHNFKGFSAKCEVEDLAAVIGPAGGKAFVFGHSSGAVLALETARLRPDLVTKLAVYEPPFILDDSRPPAPKDYVNHLIESIGAGRRGEAVEYFMTSVVGVPKEVIASMHGSPMWSGMEQGANTLPYDGIIMGDTMSGSPATIQKYASISIPTLVMDGDESPAFMHRGAEELARILPNAQHRRLPGQGHGPADDVLVPVLVEFF